MNSILDRIVQEIEGLPGQAMAKDLNRIERKLYRLMPENNDEFIAVCDEMMKLKGWAPFFLVTLLIKRKGVLYDLKYFPVYEKWLDMHAVHWGRCDILCYRVLNPMVEKFPELYGHLVKWTASPNTYTRRAAAVSLIRSTRSFVVSAGFPKVKRICDLLKKDPHPHVQKGIGWLLKYAYLKSPKETEVYLRENVKELSRTTFRYALEKMPQELREELMLK